MPTLSSKLSVTTESKSHSRANTITSAGRNSNIDSEDANEFCESGAANENVLTFETKTRKKKFNATPGWHEVNISMHFAMAVMAETSPDDIMSYRGGGSDKRTSTFDAPKVNNYYHLEFKLYPNDPDTVKTDVVFFSNCAKVYPEGNDPKPVKTWYFNNQIWAAWVQNFKVKVNNDFLSEISNHQMEIKVWDTKEKCGSKARFDRPKMYKFPQAEIDQDPDSIGGVKIEVLKLSKQLKKTPTAKLYLNRPLPVLRGPPQLEPRTYTELSTKLTKSPTTAQPTPGPVAEMAPENYAIYAVSRPDQHSTQLPFSRLNELAAPNTPETYSETALPTRAMKLPERKNFAQANLIPPLKDFGGGGTKLGINRDANNRDFLELRGGMNSALSGNVSRAETVRTRRGRKEIDPMQEYYDKNGRASISINMAHLFTKSSIIERLDDAVYPLEDMIVSVYVGESLLSDTQRVELNPLVVRIKSAKGMPSTPLNYNTLQTQCEPAYCQYKFFNTPMRKTTARPQGPEIAWDDVQVILTGLINEEEFKEYISSSAMNVEIHDRDRKPPSDNLPPALFGSDLEDEKISNIGVVTSKRTQFSAFNSDQRPWDPYALAKVEFNELLRGTKLLNLCIPLTTCPIPNVLGNEKDENDKIYGVSGAVDGPKNFPMQAGDYITAGSVLNVTIELAHSLVNRENSKVETTKAHSMESNCPFRKIIFIFSDRNDTLLSSLRKLIKQINGSAIDLGDSPDHVITNALRNYKISATDRCNPNFDLLTGFHVYDSRWHIAVLEGLKSAGINKLWHCLGKDITRKDDVKILYNESYSFSKRSYAPLDPDIGIIKTQEALEEIVKQSLLYVRDIVPAACFQGISKLSQLIDCATFHAAIMNELLPTAEMIQAFSREFGVPIYMEVARDKSPPNQIETGRVNNESIKKVFKPNESYSRWTRTIDNYNDEFCALINARENESAAPNYIQRNVRELSQASAYLRESRAQSCPAVKTRKTVHSEIAYNYSTQRLNSAVKALEELKDELDSKRNYTFSPDYWHSGSVEGKQAPQQKKMKKMSLESEYPPLDSKLYTFHKEWVYPGVKSLALCNIHRDIPAMPYKLSSQEPWIENELHTALLKPTVEGRENFPGELYEKDFHRYEPPPIRFGKEPETIMKAGDLKGTEETEEGNKEHSIWLKKLAVKDVRFHTHRILPSTEMQTSGPKSFNQIDRLKGQRKDPAQKYGLANPGYQDLPALSTLKIGMPKPPELSFTVKDDSEKEEVSRDLRKHYVSRREQNRGFNAIFRGKEVLHLRKIEPLSLEDRNNNLYYEPLTECYRA